MIHTGQQNNEVKRESARGSKVLKYFSQVLLQLMEKTGGKLRIHMANGE